MMPEPSAWTSCSPRAGRAALECARQACSRVRTARGRAVDAHARPGRVAGVQAGPRGDRDPPRWWRLASHRRRPRRHRTVPDAVPNTQARPGMGGQPRWRCVMRRRRQHGVPVIGALVLLALLAVIAAAVQIAEHLALLAVIAAVAARAFYLGRRGRRQARPRQVQQQQVDPAKLAAATPLPAAAWPLADDRDELATPEPTILQGGSDKTRLLADPPTRRPADPRPADLLSGCRPLWGPS